MRWSHFLFSPELLCAAPQQRGHVQVTGMLQALALPPSHPPALGVAPQALLCYPLPGSWSDADYNFLAPEHFFGGKWELEHMQQ